jgi:hypothetical protein
MGSWVYGYGCVGVWVCGSITWGRFDGVPSANKRATGANLRTRTRTDADADADADADTDTDTYTYTRTHGN